MIKIGKVIDKNATLIRFILVGALNTAFGYGLYCLLIFSGISTDMAVLISTIAGVLFNFKTTGALVFKNKDNSLIFRFILSYIFTYFINIGIVRLLVYHNFVDKYTAGFVATVVVAGITFLIQKRFVFNSNRRNCEKED